MAAYLLSGQGAYRQTIARNLQDSTDRRFSSISRETVLKENTTKLQGPTLRITERFANSLYPTVTPGLAAGSSIDCVCPPQLPSLHMWQNIFGKACKLSCLIGTAEANHDRLRAGGNKRLEPCNTVFR